MFTLSSFGPNVLRRWIAESLLPFLFSSSLAGDTVLAVDAALAARIADRAGHREPLIVAGPLALYAVLALPAWLTCCPRSPTPSWRRSPGCSGPRPAPRWPGRTSWRSTSSPAADLSRRPRAGSTLGDHAGSPAHLAVRPARPRRLSARDRARAAVAGDHRRRVAACGAGWPRPISRWP